MIEKINYKIVKLKQLIYLLFYDLIRAFYSNKNAELLSIIKKNREVVNGGKSFLNKAQYESNNYGIPGHIFLKLNKDINQFPTYSDLFIFFTKYLEKKVSYLEIGVSVLKNFLQLNANLNSGNLFAYDINPIVPTNKHIFNKKSSGEYSNIYLGFNEKQKNELVYFQGSVLEKRDTDNFNKYINDKKFNFIFSDALHEPDAVFQEYKNLIKSNLDNEFILYFDDLDFEGLDTTVNNIYQELKKEYKNLYFTTFYVNGWIGQHEKLHKNGVISTINFHKILKNQKIKLPKIINRD